MTGFEGFFFYLPQSANSFLSLTGVLLPTMSSGNFILKSNNKPSPQPLHTHPLNLDQAISFENAHGNMVIMQNLGLLQPISYIDLLLLFPLYRRRS